MKKMSNSVASIRSFVKRKFHAASSALLISALALAGIGYRSLSLTPSAVGPVKAMLLDVDCRKIGAFIKPLIESPVGNTPIRAQLEKFASDSGLQI